MIFISSTCLRFDPITNPNALLQLGIEGIEMSGGGAPHNLDTIRAAMDIFRSAEIAMRIHNYFPPPQESVILNFASSDEECLAKSFALAETALDLCGEFDIPYYSIHPGYLFKEALEDGKGQFDFDTTKLAPYDTAFDNFIRNATRLNDMAARRGVALALENLFPKNGTTDSLNNTFEELDEILTHLPKNILVLIDLGHLNVAAAALDFDSSRYIDKITDAYGGRIVEIHLSGNDGSGDHHAPLDANDWQWKALKDISTALGGESWRKTAVTLEARSITNEKLNQQIKLIKNNQAKEKSSQPCRACGRR